LYGLGDLEIAQALPRQSALDRPSENTGEFGLEPLFEHLIPFVWGNLDREGDAMNALPDRTVRVVMTGR
jgi:hypothetical protein